MRAAVLREVGAPLRVEDVELAEPRDDEVLVRLIASGLCHTDLEVIDGALAYPLPIVLGHEGAGVVEQVGRDVVSVAVGDHVVCSWMPNCGCCFYCDRDLPVLCERTTSTQPRGLMPDGSTRLSDASGPIHHYSVVSAHAERCVIPGGSAVRISRSVPFDRACLIGCAVMTGVGAATRMVPAAMGSNVAVFGCGAVGLNVVQGARLQAPACIVAVDVDDAKLALAQTLGADVAINAGRDDPVDAIRRLTAGRGADHVYEAAGSTATIRQALEATRAGGDVVLLGKLPLDRELSLRWGALMGEKRIVRSSYGGARPRRDFPVLAELYLEGRLRLDELITHRLGLDEINEGFAAMRRGEVLRAVVTLPC